MSEATGSKLFIHESAYVDDGAQIGVVDRTAVLEAMIEAR